MTRIDERELRADLHFLCDELGERLAGSPRERQAAEFIARRMEEAGLANVQLQAFDCVSRLAGEAEIHESRPRGKWRAVEAAPLVGSPSTPGGATVEGDIVWLMLPEAQGRLRPDSLRGTIAVIFGPMPTSAAAHRQLMAAKPLAVVHVDERFPFPWLKSDGTYPYWIKRYGLPPTVAIPYMDAWRWRLENVRRLRLRVDVTNRRAESTNVIGELPGSVPSLPAVVLTSHLDTQPGNPGADDNAAGVASILALARVLQGRRRRRTVRFVAFGAEEQLSVGAMHHVRHGGISPANTGLVLNLDSTASPLGHYVLWTAGDEPLGRFVQRALAREGIDSIVKHDITPFADTFAFNRVGIPSIWCRRMNFSGGRWQHHSRHDSLENISFPDLARLLPAVSVLVSNLAQRTTFAFQPTLSAEQQQHARKISRALLGW